MFKDYHYYKLGLTYQIDEYSDYYGYVPKREVFERRKRLHKYASKSGRAGGGYSSE